MQEDRRTRKERPTFATTDDRKMITIGASGDASRQQTRNLERVEERPINCAGMIHFAERQTGQGKRKTRQVLSSLHLRTHPTSTLTGPFFLSPPASCILILSRYPILLSGIQQPQFWIQPHQGPFKQNLSESRMPQPAPGPPRTWLSTMILEDGS